MRRGSEMTKCKRNLIVEPCSLEAARFACERWHYTRLMPPPKLLYYGVWENQQFIGAIVYGTGGISIARPFGVLRRQACELKRVALKDHKAPVTEIIALSLALLRCTNPGLRIVVSYADPLRGHLGIIYQAGNWIYLGKRKCSAIVVNGQRVHGRTCGDRWGTGSVVKLREQVDPNAYIQNVMRFKYAMPLDRSMRRRLIGSKKSYPKEIGAGSIANAMRLSLQT